MKPELRSHLLGVFRALKARIDLINSSIGHAATLGGENEAAIRELLTSFLHPSSASDLVESLAQTGRRAIKWISFYLTNIEQITR